MKTFLVILSIVVAAATGDIAKADAFVDVSMVTSWEKASSKSLILYRGSRATAIVELWDPVIFSNAVDVVFLGEDISPGDKLVVDGETVEVRKVEKIR
jgi:hypothetical protein